VITFGEYAAHLREAAAMTRPMLEAIVKETASACADQAKDYIGHQQQGWAPLAPSTVQQKRSLGSRPPDYEPLLRTGEMRDTIQGVGIGLTGIVGSSSKLALWQELGTPNAKHPIPPRPFLALAVHEMAIPMLEIECGQLAVRLLKPAGNR
jgi:hypothetical protein